MDGFSTCRTLGRGGPKNRETHSTILDIVCPYFKKEYFAFPCEIITLFQRRALPGAVFAARRRHRSARARRRAVFPWGAVNGQRARQTPGPFCSNRKTPENQSFPGFLSLLEAVGSADQRLLNCGARRAALRPYFLRSFIRGSRVRKPAFLRAGRSSGLNCSRARDRP